MVIRGGSVPDRTSGSVVAAAVASQHEHMTKRILAMFLWFYTGWYAGALIADFIGVTPMLGPIVGAAAAALIAGDPRRIIWTVRAATPATSASPEATPEPA
jgi:hypothetical protein